MGTITPPAFELQLNGEQPSLSQATRQIGCRARTPTGNNMKGLIVAILMAAIARPATAALIRQQPDSLLARVTVYWASGGKGSDHYTRRHKCATGLRLRDGHCAVDPKKIPYGSNVVLPDGTSLAAVDTGTAVRNRKAARLAGKTPTERSALVIDRFFETKRQALAWANTHPHFIPVRVIAPGSPIPRLTAKAPSPRAVRPASNQPPSQNSTGSRVALKLPKIH
jgi:3D (Asp-Asp-Asp) domain-containing protein